MEKLDANWVTTTIVSSGGAAILGHVLAGGAGAALCAVAWLAFRLIQQIGR